MASTKTKKELVSSTLEISIDQFINIDGYVHYHTDAHYEEDADGNRGKKETFVEDVTDIHAYLKSGDEVLLTPEEEQQASDRLVRKFFNN